MGREVLANSFADEGTVTGTKVVAFPWRSRRVTITNDSPTANLSVTIGSGTVTLYPTESLSIKMWLTGVTLAGTGVPYRVWAFG